MRALYIAFLIVAAVLAGIEGIRTRSLGWSAVSFLAGAALIRAGV